MKPHRTTPEQLTVVVEMYGLARLRAGRETLTVAARTPFEALRLVTAGCPNLQGLLTEAGQLDGHYLVSLNGRCFLDDLELELENGDRLLLLSADSGG
jgi:hypothetical protein